MNIRDLRLAAGLTQSDLAAKVGVAQATVAEWERGVYSPGAQKLPALAKALGCTIDELYISDAKDTA